MIYTDQAASLWAHNNFSHEDDLSDIVWTIIHKFEHNNGIMQCCDNGYFYSTLSDSFPRLIPGQIFCIDIICCSPMS